MRLLVATTNEGKRVEYERLLAGVPGLVLETMATVGADVEVEEDRDTFEGNALKKATEIAAATGLVCLADDSGLEVDALGGRPGVLSARYSGPGATDSSNNEKLLEELGSRSDRAARFRCAIAVVAPDGRVLASADGACEGRIGHEARGSHGFGYDPLFIPEGEDETLAELGPERKNEISHRALAAAALVPHLEGLGAEV